MSIPSALSSPPAPSADGDALPLLDARLLEALFPAMGARVTGATRGAINQIIDIRLADGERRLLRVRVHDSIFPYERGVVKEAFLAAWWHGQDLPPPAAGHLPPLPLLPRIRSYDWTRTLLPWPFTILEPVAGALLADRPDPAHYRALGAAVAAVHRVRFPAFYAAVTDWPDRPVAAWADRLLDAWLTAADGQSDAVRARLASLRLPPLPPQHPVLVHNDLHARNVLVGDDGAIHLIDWDNFVVDVAALDLVKLRYWTRQDADGVLTPDEDLYQTLLDGYHHAGGVPPHPAVMEACTILWLLRVVKFQTGRGGAPAGFPPASLYQADLLRRLDRWAFS